MKTFYDKYDEVMSVMDTVCVAPFVMEILSNDKNVDPDDVIDFFHYWSDMSDTAGMWIDNTTYSFDCGDNIEDGVVFDKDNITDMFESFCNDDNVHVDYLRDIIARQRKNMDDVKNILEGLKCMI